MPGAWIEESAIKKGYEIIFARHFFKLLPLRSLEEIQADIKTLEQETEGLPARVLAG